jgi:hypothetical protein
MACVKAGDEARQNPGRSECDDAKEASEFQREGHDDGERLRKPRHAMQIV